MNDTKIIPINEYRLGNVTSWPGNAWALTYFGQPAITNRHVIFVGDLPPYTAESVLTDLPAPKTPFGEFVQIVEPLYAVDNDILFSNGQMIQSVYYNMIVFHLGKRIKWKVDKNGGVLEARAKDRCAMVAAIWRDIPVELVDKLRHLQITIYALNADESGFDEVTDFPWLRPWGFYQSKQDALQRAFERLEADEGRVRERLEKCRKQRERLAALQNKMED